MQTAVWVGVEISPEIYGRFRESFPHQTHGGRKLEVLRAQNRVIGYGHILTRIVRGKKLDTSGDNLHLITAEVQRAFREQYLPWEVTLHVQPIDDPPLRPS